MSTENLKFSIIVPCYKSQKTIKKLCLEVVSAMDTVDSKFEILLVNDGSPDDLLSYLQKEVVVLDSRIVVVDLTRNFGQQSAILAGFEVAKGEFFVTMDDDLQQKPDDIKLLYNKIIESKDDVVVGSLKKKKHSMFRNFGTRLVKYVSHKSLGVPYSLDLTSFRIIRKDIAKKALLFYTTTPVVGFLLFMVTKKFSNVTVSHYSRDGQSTYNYSKLFNYFFNMLVNYSDILLVAFGKIGFIVSLFSFLLGIYYLVSWSLDFISVSGFVSIVLINLFLFGILFMFLSVIGAYLSRSLKSSSRHPMYLIRSIERNS